MRRLPDDLTGLPYWWDTTGGDDPEAPARFWQAVAERDAAICIVTDDDVTFPDDGQPGGLDTWDF